VTNVPKLRVPVGFAEAELRVRGSRFIGVAHPISRLEQALSHRDAERRRFHGATHHVIGARLVDGECRLDDDGEPSGTGGRPVLRAIESAVLHDIVVVVTRYFGGTKLGTGGLGRAYGSAAAKVLALTPCRTVVRGRRVRVSYDYEDTGAISRLLDAMGAARLGEMYEERADLEVAVAEERVDAFCREVAEATSGRATAVALSDRMLLPVDT
jgi:uncharacterized YigZ family protein